MRSYEWEAQWSWWPWMKNEKFMALSKAAAWLCSTSPWYLILRKNSSLFLPEPRRGAHHWCYRNEITALVFKELHREKRERQTTKQFPYWCWFFQCLAADNRIHCCYPKWILGILRLISGRYTVYSPTDGRIDPSWASVKTVPWHTREL